MNNGTKVRALIVDDEPLARKGIKSLLKSEEGIEIVGEAVDGMDAVTQISKHAPNLVFLDIQMPGLDGFNVIEKIGVNKMPVVIFVTAYDLHALKAFQVHAIDYLLKPVNPDQFHTALERARAVLNSKQTAGINDKLIALLHTLNVKREYPDRFIVKSTGKMVVVTVNELEWVQADGDYVRLYSKGKYHLMRERINIIEQQLDPSEFMRIHRSAIVRINRIKELRPMLNGDHLVVLHDGVQLSLSRTYRDKALSILSQT